MARLRVPDLQLPGTDWAYASPVCAPSAPAGSSCWHAADHESTICGKLGANKWDRYTAATT
jgi:hypothetical protein